MMWNDFLTIWPDRSWVFNILQPAFKKGINTAKMARGDVALVIAIGVMLNVAFSYQFSWQWLTIRSTIRSVIASFFCFLFWQNILLFSNDISTENSNPYFKAKKNTEQKFTGTGTHLIEKLMSKT